MSHHVPHMIELHYRARKLSRVWRRAYSMHVQGFETMLADAHNLHRRLEVFEWKILKVETATGDVVKTLARKTPNTIARIA